MTTGPIVTGWTDTHCHTQEQMTETGSDELLQIGRAHV